MLFFRKKVDSLYNVKATERKYKNAPAPQLEKGDRLAIFLAAMGTFGPIMLVILAIMAVLFALA